MKFTKITKLTTLRRRAAQALHLSRMVLINHINKRHVEQYLDLIDHLQTHKGPKETIKILKTYQLFVRQWTVGIPPESLKWTKVDKSGFPSVLKPWKDIICSSDHHVKQEVNTLFGAVKLLKVAPDINVESITNPFNGRSEFLTEFTDYCRTWEGPANKIRITPLNDIPLRSTKGPNGPAVYTSLQDLNALKGTELYESVKTLMSITAPNVCKYIVNKISLATERKEDIHSRLGFLRDSAGKTRVVAIGDYWSQMRLLPVHRLFIASLRSMKTDCTYRHGHLASTLKQLTDSGCWVGTIDSTAFTDRFPIGPQVAVVASVLGSQIADLWKSVLTNRDFRLKMKSTREPCHAVRYAVGQPIGIYRSWAVCVTTLHALIQYSAKKIGKPNFQGYIVLGDDVAVFDQEVYYEVNRNLGLLGVETNPRKSTQRSCGAEMAKQFFWKGHNVTGFPLSLINEVRRNPVQVLELLRNVELLEFKKLSVVRVLSLFLPRYRGKVSKLLTSPRPWGFPQVVDFSALERGKRLQEWNWTRSQIERAYKYAQYDLFFRQAKDLETAFRALEKEPDNTGASSNLPEDHPLIYGLRTLIINCQETLMSLRRADPTESVSDVQVLRLVFPPVSDVYTHGSLKHRRAHFRGHALLLALSRLENNDFSPPDGADDLSFLFEVAFARATVRSA